KEKKIPLILINGRITKKTFKRWIEAPLSSRRTQLIPPDHFVSDLLDNERETRNTPIEHCFKPADFYRLGMRKS
ncbi:MAG: hypothetical protein P8R45_05960, partial [Candidatus Binatia bacterium]|nr:hypothetical protein [Candidatus Binatia bacterium]